MIQSIHIKFISDEREHWELEKAELLREKETATRQVEILWTKLHEYEVAFKEGRAQKHNPSPSSNQSRHHPPGCECDILSFDIVESPIIATLKS